MVIWKMCFLLILDRGKNYILLDFIWLKNFRYYEWILIEIVRILYRIIY